MGSLIEELKRQEEAARAEADRLRARIEELQQDLAWAEERASRLAKLALEAARGSFDSAREAIARRCGPVIRVITSRGVC